MAMISTISLEKLANGIRSLSNLCTNPDCRARSISHNIWGQRVGAYLNGRWYCGPECFQVGAVRELTEIQKKPPERRQITTGMPLGLLMYSRGLVSEADFKLAHRVTAGTPTPIHEFLLDAGIVTEEQVTNCMAARWGYPVLPLNEEQEYEPGFIPFVLRSEYSVLPIRFIPSSRKLVVGFVTNVDHTLLRAIERIHRCEAVPCFIHRSDFRLRIDFAKPEQAIEIPQVRPKETSALIRKAAIEWHAEEILMAECRSHVWVSIEGPRRRTDLVFRIRAS